MTHWPWWISGAALASVMVFHWLSTGRLMAVSGRLSAIVNRLRHGSAEPVPEMTQAELLAAIAAATENEFATEDGETSVDAPAIAEGTVHDPEPAAAPHRPLALKAPLPAATHVLFFGGIMIGGALASSLSGLEPASGDLWSLRSEVFAEQFGSSPWLSAGALLAGGACVGFGTRMAGGCTSGHGLCGVSRLQPGSLLATAVFFGTGIAISLFLGRVL